MHIQLLKDKHFDPIKNVKQKFFWTTLVIPLIMNVADTMF